MSSLKIYKASAGSGKTYTLAQEYIAALFLKKRRNAHRHILAVTFTKDATGEMKNRILAELYGLAFACHDSSAFLQSVGDTLNKSGHPMSPGQIREEAGKALWEILHDYSRLHITTIDSFFQKVLRNLARELGKGSRFNLEMNSGKVLSDAVKAMIEKANENPQLLNWLTTYIENKLDEGSNWRIDKEIFNFSKCIYNEFFQEHEAALHTQLNHNPKLIAQTREQHALMQKRCKEFFTATWTTICRCLDENLLTLSDFSRSGTVINFFRKLAEDHKAEINKTVEECRSNPEKWPSAKTQKRAEIIALAETCLMPLLDQSLDAQRKYNTSRMITKNLHQLGLIWDVTKEIDEQNAENNRFMLADTALFLNRMIDDADAPFIYEKIGAEIQHVLIDEFQDTSLLQWKNFKSLLSEILAHNQFSLIVGDVKQSIYRWRNSDWSILNNIGRELTVHTETLEYNFRSEQEIVHFNNQFFTQAAQLLNEAYQDTFKDLSRSPFISAYDPEDVVQRRKKDDHSGYVAVRFIAAKDQENSYTELVLDQVVQQLQILQEKGIPAQEICILTRTNMQIVRIAAYLAALTTDLPGPAAGGYLNIVSADAFQLNSSPALRILMEALRCLSDPDNPVYRAQLIECIGREKPGFPIPDFDRQLAGMPLFELTGHLFRLLGLDSVTGQSSYLFTFFDDLGNYLKDNPADIHAFVKYWNEELQYKSIPQNNAIAGVRAMTIHKSKGLQFHTVIVPFCDWSLFPNAKDTTVWCGSKPGLYELELLPVPYSSGMSDTVFSEEYEKETGLSWMDNLNVLYVAFTRAIQNLLIIAKEKATLKPGSKIQTVSDLLRLSVPQMEGLCDDDNRHYEKGTLIYAPEAKKELSENLLKQTPCTFNLDFVSYAFSPGKSIFKQSNQSRDFVNPKSDYSLQHNEYIQNGNIMHALFSRINTLKDIEPAVDALIFDGIITLQDKTGYIEKINRAMNSLPQVSDWFSSNYEVRNESPIIVSEAGTITTKRPDRILMNGNRTIIIDYKFGEPKESHQKQLKEYVALLKSMDYPHVSAYLWYVEQDSVATVVH